LHDLSVLELRTTLVLFLLFVIVFLILLVAIEGDHLDVVQALRFEQPTEFLDTIFVKVDHVCRKLDQHLRRIEGAMRAKRTESSKRRKTVSINQVQCSVCPIDLSHFLDELEAYMNWAEENKAMIKATLAAKLAAGGDGSDAA
jgi:hypothetical protein